MGAKEVILKCNANIFGFQFKKDTQLSVVTVKTLDGEKENISLTYQGESTPENANINVKLISLDFFERTAEDFIHECNRINNLYDEIEKEGGQLPLYEFEIINENKESAKKVILFGLNQYLLTPNFGSEIGVKIVPDKHNISYLEYLQRSASQPFKIDFIRLESECVNQLMQIITYTTRDANGQLLQVPIITQSYRNATDENPNELMVSQQNVIDGNSYFEFAMLPSTKLKIKIYGKTNSFMDSAILSILNSVLSCQIQQGVDYVSVENIRKFTGNHFDDYFYKGTVEKLLSNLFEKGFLDFKDGLYGYKFRILKVDGTVSKELSLTKVLQHSEYNINN